MTPEPPHPSSAATVGEVVEALAGVGPLPLFLSTHGPDGAAQWFNPQWRRFTGASDQAALGWGWLDATFAAADGGLVCDEWQRRIAAGEPFTAELRYRRHDGAWRAYNLRAAPLGDGSGPPSSWVCVHVDAAASSPALAAHTRAILDSAVDAIVTIDERGIVHSINPAGEQMFGYAAAEVVGHNVKLLMPEPYASEHDAYLQRYLSTGEKRIIGIGRESEGLRKSGQRFPIDLAISEIDLGEERLFTGIVRDLTERKEAERQVKQAERLAMIGQTVSTLAHESRNYLQRIHIALDSAQLRVGEDGALAELLGDVARATDGLNSLLDEVRSYAAPIHVELREAELAGVWREAWGMLAPQRAGRQCRLVEEIGDSYPAVRIDRFRLVQAFRNFFENSLAACRDPVEATIAVRPTTLGEKEAIEIEMAANGPGLTIGQRRRVFEPFFTTKARGTGLGMAIAMRVVEAHGGRLSVLDDGRPGARFRIVLPR